MTARDWTAVREALLAVDATAIEAAMRKGDRAAMKRAGGTAGRLMNAIRDVLILDALPAFDESVWQFIDPPETHDRETAAEEVA